MADKNKYPIKYVGIALKDTYKIRTLTHDEKYYGDPYAYVVARAWLISETKTYKVNGGYTMTYNVVPEWTQEIMNNEPKFNLYDSCYNTICVDKIFNSYDEAKAYYVAYNNEILSQKLAKHNPEIISEMKKKYKEQLEDAYKLEKEHNKNINSKKR